MEHMEVVKCEAVDVVFSLIAIGSCRFTPQYHQDPPPEGQPCNPSEPPFPGFTLFGTLETPNGNCFCVWTNNGTTAFTRCN